LIALMRYQLLPVTALPVQVDRHAVPVTVDATITLAPSRSVDRIGRYLDGPVRRLTAQAT
jgi:hypothetical protein